MRTLKVTEELRADSENEAQEWIVKVKEEASEKGYTVGAAGYTYKAKKAKGEVIDSCYLVKVVKIYSEVWD